ncbi:MAG: hypothetical protein WA398_07700 [Nitrososphaeraceae archaeon]
MTFKDLQKVVESQPISEPNQLLKRLRGKSFWYWDQNRHKERDRATRGDCCFNHVVDLPRKDGTEKPIFDYEKQLYNALMLPGYLNSYPHSKVARNYPNVVMHPSRKNIFGLRRVRGLELQSSCLGLWPGSVFVMMIIRIVRWS